MASPATTSPVLPTAPPVPSTYGHTTAAAVTDAVGRTAGALLPSGIRSHPGTPVPDAGCRRTPWQPHCPGSEHGGQGGRGRDGRAWLLVDTASTTPSSHTSTRSSPDPAAVCRSHGSKKRAALRGAWSPAALGLAGAPGESSSGRNLAARDATGEADRHAEGIGEQESGGADEWRKGNGRRREVSVWSWGRPDRGGNGRSGADGKPSCVSPPYPFPLSVGAWADPPPLSLSVGARVGPPSPKIGPTGQHPKNKSKNKEAAGVLAFPSGKIP
ncbi:hypothetical protein D1007_32131 [Hordeum vulgare]|nr:hypothetical protein D1007_32131 [Hordeum vulgare]